ncbi:MAG TPA: SdrD B-like domain-containing protein, partial [Pirellulaceae bacterium]|nr:SdrD B-like domain-containing protein [Pirellulaceae bacterium]
YRDQTNPNSVTGTIWRDTDTDGALEATETGRFAGVTVVLYDSTGRIVARTTTDANGDYTFSGLPDGSYVVDVTDDANVLDGAWQSLGTAGVDSQSQTDPYSLTLAGGQTGNADFGYYRDLATISNFVWNDYDGDGVQDAGEPGLVGVQVTLTITYPNGQVSTQSQLTDASGFYAFSGLLADENYNGDTGDGSSEPTYFVQLAIPQGYSPSPPYRGGNTALDSEPAQGSFVSVLEGQTNSTIDFGLRPHGTIGDIVWLDENANGVQDVGESGIPGLTVTLTPPAGTDLGAGAGQPVTTITGLDGGYSFRGLPTGTYTITVTPASGLFPTYDYNGVGTPNTTTVALTAGAEFVDADFGYDWNPTTDVNGGTNTGAIGDRVWADTDGDGVQDSNEAGLAGVSVALIGVGPDGRYGTSDDVTVATTTTDPSGRYLFDNLSAGAYVVVVNGGSAPAGYTQTGDPDATMNNRSNVLPLAPGDVYSNFDFGYQPTFSSSVGTSVYLDLDADGVRDAGEPGLAGVTVTLLNSLNQVVATTLTDANGFYQFTGVTSGSYTIAVTDTRTVLTGLYQSGDPDGTLDSRYTLSVDGTSSYTGIHFGYVPAGHDPGEGLIGDTVFIDRNASGGLDAGEALEGVTVRLYGVGSDGVGNTADDVLLATKNTDENGRYYFGGLNSSSTYVIKVDTTTLPGAGVDPLTNTIDPQGALDSTAIVTLTPGSPTNLTTDFGYRDTTAPNTIAGTIWDDTDADGTLDAAETTRYANVTVVLRDTAGNILASTTTDAFGNYSFVGLPSGTYVVDVTDETNVLDGAWHSLGTAGVDNQSQTDTYTLAVTGGGTYSPDFGYYKTTASVGDRVWQDSDGDGIQDSGEPGLAGVTVTLTVTYPNGVTTVVSTITDSTGFYSFPNLLSDENYDGVGTAGIGGVEPLYVLSATAPTNYRKSPFDQGADDSIDADNSDGATVTLAQGVFTNTYDFGFVPVPGSIGDRVWLDENGNGVQDAGESGIAGLTVTLTGDYNGDGTPDTLTTVTDQDGGYVFPRVLPGTFVVTVTPTAGLNPTFDRDGTATANSATITIAAAQRVVDADFGYNWTPPTDSDNPSSGATGAIGDRLWIDVDGDGVQDPGEAG